MGRVRAVIALAVALLAGGMPAPARASHCTGSFETYDLVRFSDVGWVVYKVRVEPLAAVTTAVTIQTDTDDDASVLVGGTWLLDETGSLIDAVVGGSIQGQGLLVHGQAIEEEKAVDLHVGPGRTWIAAGSSFPETGIYFVVLAAGSDRFAGAEADLCGEGVEILGRTDGITGFVAGDRDFAGMVNAAAGTPAAWAEIGGTSAAADPFRARAAMSADVTATVNTSLYGAFATTGDLRTRIGYDGPSGSRDDAKAYLFSGDSPGAYRFREDLAVGAGSTATWAWGVDVALP